MRTCRSSTRGSTSCSATRWRTAASTRTCWPTTTPPSPSAPWPPPRSRNTRQRWTRRWNTCGRSSGPTRSRASPTSEQGRRQRTPTSAAWATASRSAPDGCPTRSVALEALHDAGLKQDDPAFQAALKFVTRCQNNSETNDQKWAGDDGGFVYTPADGGEGQRRRVHRARRPQAAPQLRLHDLRRPQEHDLRRPRQGRPARQGRLEVDPEELHRRRKPRHGARPAPKNAKGGLYYYYHTIAKALRAYGEPVITDAQGSKHDWRVELIAQDRLPPTARRELERRPPVDGRQPGFGDGVHRAGGLEEIRKEFKTK